MREHAVARLTFGRLRFDPGAWRGGDNPIANEGIEKWTQARREYAAGHDRRRDTPDQFKNVALCDRVHILRADARQNIPIELTRSEEHTSELQSLMRISYAVFCL